MIYLAYWCSRVLCFSGQGFSYKKGVSVKRRMLCTIHTCKYDTGQARRLSSSITRERGESSDQSKRVICIAYGRDKKEIKERRCKGKEEG